MAYETGGSSGVTDLLDKLRVFALANGWTVDFYGARTDVQDSTNISIFAIPNTSLPSYLSPVPGNSLLLHKGGAYFAVHTDTRTVNLSFTANGPYILTQVFTGPYSGALVSTAQAGHSGGAATNKLVGPFQAYHFFALGNYIHVVVEIAPAEFRHFGFGILESAGAVTNGSYATGTNWSQESGSGYKSDPTSFYHNVPFDDQGGANQYASSAVRADVDGISPGIFWVNQGFTNSPPRRAFGGFRRQNDANSAPLGLARLLVRVPPSSLTGRAILVPLNIGVTRSGFFSMIGSPRDVRVCRIDNLNPGDLVTIGPDTWKVFPVSRKNGLVGQENSGGFGFAYRQVA